MAENDQGVEALIQFARANPTALGQLLERYRSFLVLMAQRQIEPQRAAECDASGIVQDTLAEACRGFERFAGSTEAEFSAWLKQIHRHNILDRVRRHRPEVSIPRDPDDSASFYWWEPAANQLTASQRLIKGERALRLAGLLQSLPETQREAVRLRHLEGWSVEKIAGQLDRSVAATAGLIKRGLQALREKMSEGSWI
jgi:RNA polymerase sigma-70 factor, ECF subfamily